MNEVMEREDYTPAETVQRPAMQVAPTYAASGAVAIAQSKEISEALGRIQIAKVFPRDMKQAREMMRAECMEKELAETAVYRYARGGADVTGASIRLAEKLALCLGNIDAGWREIETSPEASKCEAFAWDIERNVKQSITFTVSHYRHTKKGDYLLTDPRDIYEKCANEAARRKRAAILAVIPAGFVNEAMEICENTLKISVELSPERITKMLENFAVIGVSQAMIENRLQRNTDAITAAQFIDLGRIYNSIKDGIGKVANYFEAEPPAVEDAKPANNKTLRGKLGLESK